MAEPIPATTEAAPPLLVHDRPCRECRHSRQLVGGWICERHHMAITPCMFVSFFADPPPGQPGLCFEVRQP